MAHYENIQALECSGKMTFASLSWTANQISLANADSTCSICPTSADGVKTGPSDIGLVYQGLKNEFSQHQMILGFLKYKI